MKVLVISHMYPNTMNEMAGIFVHKQVKALIDEGCEVRVVSPTPLAPFPLGLISSKWKKYSEIPKRVTLEGVDICYPRYLEFPKGIFFSKSGYFMARGIKKNVKKIINEFKPDIIHSHVALPDGFAAMVINEEFNLPHVTTIHGQDFQQTIYRSEDCKNNLFKVLNKCDAIITVSNKLKNIVSKEEFYDKIQVIHNGVDIPHFSYIEENKEYIEVLSVGNLLKIKGIDLNIRALKPLMEKYENLIYTIIGDGIERANLEALCEELNIKERVKFLGRLPHNEAMEHMKKCDIYSMPSYKEGFGVVYIEAMSFGKPVIGVRGEGINDIIEDGVNGMLVEPKDVYSLMDKLEKLIVSKELRENIGKRGQEKVINECTWISNAKKNLMVYNKLLKE
ncbi:MAG: glycosyltransferase [Clostridium argentinense]|uniref:Glycosyltransferase n=1 Tax=Clostridium faecium TaxID=2762223 RepID=A0ABR8YVN8_9CLOT|nr:MULTISPECIES: glycosyltransferase [Clostridium]MBD8048011.1 glycosyltransferase [Clostridium faecium]MBS5822602.1 glycosyltransferase [Clostridium argentinense]MDU1347833.1 glycosyltransferase [Clostridium argentinense]